MREPGKVHWVHRTWEDTLGWTPADNGGDLAPLLYPHPATLRKTGPLPLSRAIPVDAQVQYSYRLNPAYRTGTFVA